jgi:hypothetical protein
MDTWHHIDLPGKRGISLKEGEFFALEGYNLPEKKKYRLYGRITKALVEDEIFLDLLSSGKYEFINELSVQEKELIYNTCH